MKKLFVILSVFLMAGIIGCQKELNDLEEKAETSINAEFKVIAASPENCSVVRNIIMNTNGLIGLNTETKILEENLPENNLKSASVVQYNYFEVIAFGGNEQSFLQFWCRNSNYVNGQTGFHVMNQFLIQLPDFISDEDIDEIKYTRKKYEGEVPMEIEDDEWRRMDKKIKKNVKVNGHDVSNALKIEQGTQLDNWLIVKIQLNKSVGYRINAPYHIKTASEWYPLNKLGFGEKNNEYGQWNNVSQVSKGINKFQMH